MPFWMDDTTLYNLPIAGSLCLPRLMAVMGLMPFFSSQVLTGLIRQGVAASLLLIVVPPVALTIDPSSLGLMYILGLTFKEVAVGMMLGFPFAIVFWAFEGAGFFIDNQRGASMASSMDPLTGSQTTVLGTLFTQAFTIYFLVSGTFLTFLTVVYTSYKIWPVTEFFPTIAPELPMYYLSLLDSLMATIVTLAAPVIAAMFLSEMGLALISRFAPQLNVFFLAMPVKSGVGIFVLIVYLPIMFSLSDELKGDVWSVWSGIQGMLQ